MQNHAQYPYIDKTTIDREPNPNWARLIIGKLIATADVPIYRSGNYLGWKFSYLIGISRMPEVLRS